MRIRRVVSTCVALAAVSCSDKPEAPTAPRAPNVAALIGRPLPTLAQLSTFDNTMICDVGANLGPFIVRTWGRDVLIALVRSNGNLPQTLGLTDCFSPSGLPQQARRRQRSYSYFNAVNGDTRAARRAGK